MQLLEEQVTQAMKRLSALSFSLHKNLRGRPSRLCSSLRVDIRMNHGLFFLSGSNVLSYSLFTAKFHLILTWINHSRYTRSALFLRDIALGILCSPEPNDHQHLPLQFSTARLISPSPIGHPQQFQRGRGGVGEKAERLHCSSDFHFQQAGGGDIFYHPKPNG